MLFIRFSKNRQKDNGETPSIYKERVVKHHPYPEDVNSLSVNGCHLFTFGFDSRLKRQGDKIYFFDGFISSVESQTPYFKEDIDYFVNLVENGTSNFLDGMRGRFLCGYYDLEMNTLKIYSDYHGFKTLFFTEGSDYFEISSKYQILTEYEYFDRDINRESLEEFMSLGLILENKTFFNKLNQLPAGASLGIHQNKIEISPRPKRTFDSRWLSASIRDVADEFSQRLTRSLDTLINKFNIDTMLMTGGSDTRILLGALSHENKNRLTFCTTKDPRWSPNNNDLVIAQQLAQSLHLNHKIFEGKTYDSRGSSMAKYAYHSQYVPYGLITGTFGTELVGQGVWGYLPVNFSQFRKDKYQERRSYLFNTNHTSATDPIDKLTSGIDSQAGPCKTYQYLMPFFWRSFFSDIYSKFGTHLFLSSYELQNYPKLSPFLMPEILDLLMQLPQEYLINYRIYEELFKSKYKPLAEIPFNSTMTKFAGGIMSVQTSHPNKNEECFDHEKFLMENIDHEALDPYLFNRDNIQKSNFKDNSLTIRLVDYIFWYENAVKNNFKFGEDI